MWVRFPPLLPDRFGQIDRVSRKLDDDGPNYQGPTCYPQPLAGGDTQETPSQGRTMSAEGRECSNVFRTFKLVIVHDQFVQNCLTNKEVCDTIDT